MSVYLCVYLSVYMCLWICVYMSLCICVFMCLFVYVPLYVSKCVYVSVYLCVCICVYMCIVHCQGKRLKKQQQLQWPQLQTRFYFQTSPKQWRWPHPKMKTTSPKNKDDLTRKWRRPHPKMLACTDRTAADQFRQRLTVVNMTWIVAFSTGQKAELPLVGHFFFFFKEKLDFLASIDHWKLCLKYKVLSPFSFYVYGTKEKSSVPNSLFNANELIFKNFIILSLTI